jgi:O-antigen/teichoic acid export membrane protein
VTSIAEDAGNASPQRASMTRDLIWTTFTSAAILLGNVILASLLAQRGAAEVFGPYQLAKRVGASLMPVVSLGLGLGIVKLVASAKDERTRDLFTVIGVNVTLLVIALASGCLVLFPDEAATLLLGSDDTPLMWAMWAYVVALTLNTMVYSFYRSEFRQTRANWNTLIAMTIAPTVLVWLAPTGWKAVALLASVSALVIAWNGTQLLVRMFQAFGRGLERHSWREAARELLVYSTSRVPGSIAMSFILTVGALVATRAGEYLTASYVLAGMTLVQVAGASLQAFSTVLMPRVAELDAQGRADSVSGVAGRLIFLGTALSVMIVPLLWTITPDLARVWLGPEFVEAIPAMRLMAFAIPSVLFIAVLRGVLDATVRQPVNTYAATLGLFVCGAISLAVAADDSVALSLAFLVGQTVSATIMFGVILARFRPALHLGYHALLGVIAVLGSLLTLAAGSVSGDMAAWVRLVVGIAFGGALLAASLWFAPHDTGLSQRVRRLVGRSV